MTHNRNIKRFEHKSESTINTDHFKIHKTTIWKIKRCFCCGLQGLYSSDGCEVDEQIKQLTRKTSCICTQRSCIRHVFVFVLVFNESVCEGCKHLYFKAGQNSCMTRFENEVRMYCQSQTNLKAGKWGWNKWNGHILVYIYHKQCEFIQKNSMKRLKRPISVI